MTPSMELFDLDCLTLETAIRAVWILYRRGKWNLLEEIGLSKERYNERFYKFDTEYIMSDHGLLRRAQQVEAFADACPGVRIAAMELNDRYREAFREVLDVYKSVLSEMEENDEQDLPFNQ